MAINSLEAEVRSGKHRPLQGIWEKAGLRKGRAELWGAGMAMKPGLRPAGAVCGALPVPPRPDVPLPRPRDL